MKKRDEFDKKGMKKGRPGFRAPQPVVSKGDDSEEKIAVEGLDVVEGAVVATESKPQDSGFIEKVVAINRITKVTKGGKKLSFSALVVVGDSKGKVGYSLEKAAEVSIAIRKAVGVAKNHMMNVNMRGSTIPHEVVGECGAARVLLKPAAEGTGVIAAGPVRAICDGAGIRNILTKCHRSNNPINVIKATFEGLSRLKEVK
jgi:small subunit ribosomal protein S5